MSLQLQKSASIKHRTGFRKIHTSSHTYQSCLGVEQETRLAVTWYLFVTKHLMYKWPWRSPCCNSTSEHAAQATVNYNYAVLQMLKREQTTKRIGQKWAKKLRRITSCVTYSALPCIHSKADRTSSSLLSIDPCRPRKKNEQNEVQNYTRPYRLTSVKRICNPKLKLREMKLTSFY